MIHRASSSSFLLLLLLLLSPAFLSSPSLAADNNGVRTTVHLDSGASCTLPEGSNLKDTELILYKPSCGDRVHVTVNGTDTAGDGTVLLSCKNGQCEGPAWSLVVDYSPSSPSSSSASSPGGETQTRDRSAPCLGIKGNLKTPPSNISGTFEIANFGHQQGWGGIAITNFCTDAPHMAVLVGALAPTTQGDHTPSSILLGKGQDGDDNNNKGGKPKPSLLNGSSSSSPSPPPSPAAAMEAQGSSGKTNNDDDGGSHNVTNPTSNNNNNGPSNPAEVLSRPVNCSSTNIGLNLTDAAIVAALPVTALETRSIHKEIKDAHGGSILGNQANGGTNNTNATGGAEGDEEESQGGGTSVRISLGTTTNQVDIICTGRLFST